MLDTVTRSERATLWGVGVAVGAAVQQGTQDAVAYFSAHAQQFDSLYETSPDFAHRLRVWRQLIDRYSAPEGLTLDVGCGSGVMTFFAAQRSGRVIGVDGAAEMLALCEERRRTRRLENVRFVQGLLPDLDEQGLDNADLIICSSVLEYVDDLDAALRRLARLLRPGGTLVLSMPTLLCVNRAYQRIAHRFTGRAPIYDHIKHFTTPHLLSRRVSRLGLSLREVHYYDHHNRFAQLTVRMRLPEFATEDLFAAAFHKA